MTLSFSGNFSFDWDLTIGVRGECFDGGGTNFFLFGPIRVYAPPRHQG